MTENNNYMTMDTRLTFHDPSFIEGEEDVSGVTLSIVEDSILLIVQGKDESDQDTDVALVLDPDRAEALIEALSVITKTLLKAIS